MNAWVLQSDELGLEKNLTGLRSLAAELKSVSVGQVIVALVVLMVLLLLVVEVEVFL